MKGFVFIIISALCEAFWNIYLTKSKGLTDWIVNILGLFFLIISIITFKKGLYYTSLSIAIVIWSGVSLLVTIAFDMYIFKTRIDFKVAFFMSMCIISIIGLNYYSKAK